MEKEIDVRDFILNNVTVYTGDESFLQGPTEATKKLWEQVMELSKLERERGGVLNMDTEIVSTITSHGPGYLNKELEKLLVFKQTNRLNGRLCHLAAFAWRSKHAKLTDMK